MFLLFAATVLLLITTISAPIINNISLLRVNLNPDSPSAQPSVSFGTFGYCILNGLSGNSNDVCTKSHIGYSPAEVISQVDATSFEVIADGTSESLTRVMVLHPIACGITFIAFLLSCGAGIVGSFVGAMVAFLAWVLTLIALATDLSLFGIIKHHVDNDTESSANFGAGIWCLVGAFVALFLGMIIVFFTCCAARRDKRRRSAPVEKTSPPRRRKRFGIF